MSLSTNFTVTQSISNNSKLAIIFPIKDLKWYRITIHYRNIQAAAKASVNIDNIPYGETWFSNAKDISIKELLIVPLSPGEHDLTIEFLNKTVVVEKVILEETPSPEIKAPSFTLNNPEASQEAKALMSYLKSIYGKKILSGQQTTYTAATELKAIYDITGKQPAVRGFDLLSYSPACDTPNQSPHCMEEIKNNQGAIEAAIEWSKEYHGIVTFCWHWFSPIKGKDKSFYSKFTNYDTSKAVIEGTKEYNALVHDIDCIAKELNRLQDKHIPVLWRPLHEADGDWFWWGGNPDLFKKLYRLLYDRLTNYHKLNNLIWVLNVLGEDFYPGDDYVDLVSADQYPPSYCYGPLTAVYNHIAAYCNDKAAALGEIGTFPNPDLIFATKTPWLWFVTWCGSFIESEDFTKHEYIREVYHHPNVVTLENLPDINQFIESL